MNSVLRELEAPAESEGSASPRLAARVGGFLFLGSAALTALATQLPLPGGVDRGGYWVLAGAQLLLGALMLGSGRFEDAAAERLKGAAVMTSVLTIGAAILFAGAGTGGSALLSIFYVLPAIYVGYFFHRLAAAAVVLASTATFCAASAAVGVGGSAVAVRGVVIFSVLAGVTAAVHVVRLHVDSLLARLELQARVDPLTTLLNRRGFDERLGSELERLRRTGRPLALAVGDLDHFKLINDGFGHAAGDDALREVGQALAAAVRSVDAVARIGGEEFAVLMPETDTSAAVAVVDRLRARIAEVTDPGGKAIAVTFGVATTEGPSSRDAASLLLAADRALYAGKASGRGDTILWRDGAPHHATSGRPLQDSSPSTAAHAADPAPEDPVELAISPARRE